jgi:DNA-binding transcriptional MerR regulator
MGGTMVEQRYRVGELARLAGVNPRTVDYYTTAGLLPPAARSSGGHRYYDGQALGRLRLIKALRAQGLSLVAIRQRLEAPALGPALPRLAELEGELRRLDGEVAELAPQLAAGGMERMALYAALAAAARVALELAQNLTDLLGQLGTGVLG